MLLSLKSVLYKSDSCFQNKNNPTAARTRSVEIDKKVRELKVASRIPQAQAQTAQTILSAGGVVVTRSSVVLRFDELADARKRMIVLPQAGREGC